MDAGHGLRFLKALMPSGRTANEAAEGAARMRTICLAIVVICFLSGPGCAWKAYDPEHPREYSDYWNDRDNRRNSILYPFTDEARGREEGPYRP